MPRIQFPRHGGVVALGLVLFGCTSTSGIDIASQLQQAAEEAVEERAEASPVETASGETVPDETAQADEGEALPGVVAAGYAGTTPSGPKAVQAGAQEAFRGGKVAARSPELDRLIAHYADHHDIPLELLRRVVNRESTFNPAARNGPYWGLMQIHPQTARTMGYRGEPQGLLDAETNLKYAGKYLRGAYITAGGNHDQAVRLYARGYYYDAKRKGLLEATGLRPPRSRLPAATASASAVR